MPSPLIDPPEALDAAIAAGRHAQRERLVRAVRNQRIRSRVAFGLSGCVAIFALVAFLFAKDDEAAAILGIMACVTFGFSYVAGKSGGKKAEDALRKIDQPMP
jgi:hypothetical protein